jgi:hypothetical protein
VCERFQSPSRFSSSFYLPPLLALDLSVMLNNRRVHIVSPSALDFFDSVGNKNKKRAHLDLST